MPRVAPQAEVQGSDESEPRHPEVAKLRRRVGVVGASSMRPIAGHIHACLCLCLGLLALGALLAVPAGAEDVRDHLEAKRLRLDRAQQLQGVQTTTLARLSERVERKTGEVAALRNREAAVQDELIQVEAELADVRAGLETARVRLHRTVRALRTQLVTMYKSDAPGLVNVVLDSQGFDDLLSRAEYLGSIQAEGESLAERVSELRDQRLEAVETIRNARDAIAAREAELQRTRIDLEAKQTSLIDARKRQSAALAKTRTHIGSLQQDVGRLNRKVEAQVRAAEKAAAEQAATQNQTPSDVPTGGVAAPASTASDASGGLIWPVQGTVTSPFGPRWGGTHEGIDIGAAEGTPIRAAQAGRVLMAGWNGGYGNYTCIDHGGGLSTCYAHQSSISVQVGEEVAQGAEIGAVGNTGNSFGAHLHFETRVNGTAEDPLGYL